VAPLYQDRDVFPLTSVSSRARKPSASAIAVVVDVDQTDEIPPVSEMPHGGYKQSGYCKDLSVYALEDYTQVKHIMVKLD
jgi:betaine-aldehyde dehydrogenase